MKVICLGDSITAGPENWVELVDQGRGIWINAGIAGDTADGMLARLRTDILPQKPDYVFLLGGINDILITGSDHTARSAMMAMIHQCVREGVRPILGIPYVPVLIPVYLRPVCAESWEKAAEEYSDWLRKLGKALRLRTVDFSQVIDGDLLADGLHPSKAGAEVMAELIRQRFGRQL